MTSHSPNATAVAQTRKAITLNFETVAFVGLFLGLVYLLTRSCSARCSKDRPRAIKEEDSHTQSATEFMISENVRF